MVEAVAAGIGAVATAVTETTPMAAGIGAKTTEAALGMGAAVVETAAKPEALGFLGKIGRQPGGIVEGLRRFTQTRFGRQEASPLAPQNGEEDKPKGIFGNNESDQVEAKQLDAANQQPDLEKPPEPTMEQKIAGIQEQLSQVILQNRDLRTVNEKLRGDIADVSAQVREIRASMRSDKESIIGAFVAASAQKIASRISGSEPASAINSTK